MLVFSKEKMLARLEREGRIGDVTEKELAIMDNLDGCEATRSCWQRQVYGDPVLYVIGKDGTGLYVNENDCE